MQSHKKQGSLMPSALQWGLAGVTLAVFFALRMAEGGPEPLSSAVGVGVILMALASLWRDWQPDAERGAKVTLATVGIVFVAAGCALILIAEPRITQRAATIVWGLFGLIGLLMWVSLPFTRDVRSAHRSDLPPDDRLRLEYSSMVIAFGLAALINEVAMATLDHTGWILIHVLSRLILTEGRITALRTR